MIDEWEASDVTTQLCMYKYRVMLHLNVSNEKKKLCMQLLIV